MSTQTISPLTHSVFCDAAQVLKPPPRVSVTEWAEREMVLSSEDSAEGGSRYRSARAPYQRGMMDAILDPSIEELVLMTSAQVGKTLVFKNILGYFIKQDPSSIVWMVPTLDLAKKVSTQRLMPMFRDVPALAGLFDLGSRKIGNSALEKSFPGGVLFLVGANSAASLSSMPIRIVLADEVDRYPLSAGPEGDPINLIAKRQTTYWNRKRCLASTPTMKGASRIEAAYDNSDRRKFWLPCPHCSQAAGQLDGFQVLKWKRLVHGTAPLYADCVYPCEHCGAALTEADRPWMLRAGEWRSERESAQLALDAHHKTCTPNERVILSAAKDPCDLQVSSANQETSRTPSQCPDCEALEKSLAEAPAEGGKVAGFWLSEMYSPFVTWQQMVQEFRYAAHHRENPELMKTFVNLALAETYEERGESLDGNELMRRRESYPPPALPDGVTILTCGVDVQQDRLECEIVGWGKGEESWSIDFLRFDGDTSRLIGNSAASPSPWQQLDRFLQRARYRHARGVWLPIAATFVDSGYQTQVVYSFTGPRNFLRIYASKGVAGFGKTPLANWNRANRHRAKVYPVAVDVLKELLYARLRIEDAGAGYMHFSRENMNSTPLLPEVEGAVRLGNNADYFAQLTAEKIVSRPVRGFPMRRWELRVPGSRNEALDCRVYAYAAFLSLSQRPAQMLERERKRLLAEARQHAAAANENQMSLLDPQPIPAGEALPEAPAEDPVEAVAEEIATAGIAENLEGKNAVLSAAKDPAKAEISAAAREAFQLPSPTRLSIPPPPRPTRPANSRIRIGRGW
jgi:phage terminase large subunit GpA-like protein